MEGGGTHGRLRPASLRSLSILLALMTAVAIASCGEGEGPASGAPATDDLGPIHVHGLGVNPSDEALFLATHTGLFRIPADSDEAARVGGLYQDTMGFTVIGPDRFLGSGHPDLRQDLPPYLGLIESTDAGEEWDSVSLLGRADFHVLEAAGERVYGFGSDFKSRREQLLASRDGGRSWRQLRPPESLVSLAIDPSDDEHIVISGRRALYTSTDAGESWRPIAGEPGLLSWPDPESIHLVDGDGQVMEADEPGSEWSPVGDVGGEVSAFEAVSSEELFVALHDGLVRVSTDGGRTWAPRSAP